MIPAVSLRHITKSYGLQRVLADVSLSVAQGSIVSLIGENGAGKSTLGKIIAGITRPDTGTLEIFGTTASFTHPADATRAGVGIVHQEISLLDNLSVAENICLGREPTRYGLLDRASMLDIASRSLAQLSVSIDPHRRVGTLSLAQKQRVEIARALAYQAKLLVFDEPTSSLSEQDAQALVSAIASLREMGVTSIYISHRLSEVMQVSDRVIALRDGVISGELEPPFADRAQLIECMVGRKLDDTLGYTPRPLGAPILELSDYRASETHSPLTISVREGEILGIAGLVGSGRTELLEGLFGIHPSYGGNIRIRGKVISIRSPQDAMRAGLALAPESRKDQGIIPAFSISESITLSPFSQGKRAPLVRSKKYESTQAEQCISDFAVKCSGKTQPIGELSGGNQQKVVLGRCLASSPAVLLLDEPTRGIDVGARRAIYQLLFSLAEKGLAIIVVSSELEEVFGISDSVAVMNQGRVTGILARKDFSEHAFMTLASPRSLKEK